MTTESINQIPTSLSNEDDEGGQMTRKISARLIPHNNHGDEEKEKTITSVVVQVKMIKIIPANKMILFVQLNNQLINNIEECTKDELSRKELLQPNSNEEGSILTYLHVSSKSGRGSDDEGSSNKNTRGDNHHTKVKLIKDKIAKQHAIEGDIAFKCIINLREKLQVTKYVRIRLEYVLWTCPSDSAEVEQDCRIRLYPRIAPKMLRFWVMQINRYFRYTPRLNDRSQPLEESEWTAASFSIARPIRGRFLTDFRELNSRTVHG